MAQQTINNTPIDGGTGDTLYTTTRKVNENFTDIYLNKTDKGGYVGTTQDLKNDLDTAVFTSIQTYQTFADLPTAPYPAEGTPAKVANDADPDLNGFYSVVSSAWVKDEGYISNNDIIVANQFQKVGETDSSVLLAGGGHKLVSEFSLTEYTKIHPSSTNVINTKVLQYNEQYPKGLFLGNSIMQGVGASAVANRIPNKFISKLGSFYSISSSLFNFNNYGVGGATSAICLSYISNAFDGTDMTKNNELSTEEYDYVVILPLRNDEARYSRKTTEEILKTTILNARNQGLDVYLIVDPPKIDVSGDIVDGVVFQEQLDAAYAAADKYGANLVDVWGYFKNLYDNGIDISVYYDDLVHPNDSGHDLIADILLECVTRNNNINPIKPKLQYEACTNYVKTASSNGVLNDVTGLSTEATSRELELSEVTPQAYSLADTETISFNSPIPCYAIMVTVIGNSGGTLSGTYAGVSLGITLTDGGSSVREFVHYIRLTSPLSGQKATLDLTSTGVTRITGVTFIGMSKNQQFYRVPEFTSNTTPTNQTFVNGIEALQIANDGDFIEFDVYGENMDMSYEERSTNGIFELSIDGVLYNTYDAYNVTRTKKPINVPLGELNWHTIRIEINGKNASSSAFTTVFGDFRIFSNAFSKYVYVDARSTNIDFRFDIERANTIKNITNTLEAYKNFDKNIISNSNSAISILEIQ